MIKDTVSLLTTICDTNMLSLLLNELKNGSLFDKKIRQEIASGLMSKIFINKSFSLLEEFVAKTHPHFFSIMITGVNEVLWACVPVETGGIPLFVHLSEDKKGERIVNSLSFAFE